MNTYHKLFSLRLLASILLLTSVLGCSTVNDDVSEKLHTFYYNWYGNPEFDGAYRHWDHGIVPHWSDTTWNNAIGFEGGDNIGANFYPELGCYSSNDPAVVERHMQMMRQAGIGVIAITWWGKDSFEDASIPMYLDYAERHGLKVAFHIEPCYTSAQDLKRQLHYIQTTYGNHGALYRPYGKPFYYVYDSYKLEIEEWQKLLGKEGELSIRSSELDGTFIGLWVEEDDRAFFETSGFDGFYTYFASDGFVHGSTASNWGSMAQFAKEHDLLFIPCIGPGYLDTRIRPWNDQNTKEREKGAYYDRMSEAALQCDPAFIGITSFNEWHEGTQIEPSISKEFEGYKYSDFEGLDTEHYLEQTRRLSQRLMRE